MFFIFFAMRKKIVTDRTLVCRDCGKAFERWARRCLLCRDCSAIRVANHNKDASRKYRKDHPEKVSEYQKQHKKDKIRRQGIEGSLTDSQKNGLVRSFILKCCPDFFKNRLKPLRRCDIELFKCKCCGDFFEADSDSQVYCSSRCKSRMKEQRRKDNTEFKDWKKEHRKTYLETHPEVHEKIKKRARSRLTEMPIERRNEINARRRERGWKNGRRKSNSPDLPINKVYLHTFPNGKVYVGITKNTELRWDNGEGYIDNKAMYDDINKFGWDNIKHEVIADGLLRNDALKIEAQYIFMFDSTNPLKGYNRTNCSKIC